MIPLGEMVALSVQAANIISWAALDDLYAQGHLCLCPQPTFAQHIEAITAEAFMVYCPCEDSACTKWDVVLRTELPCGFVWVFGSLELLSQDDPRFWDNIRRRVVKACARNWDWED